MGGKGLENLATVIQGVDELILVNGHYPVTFRENLQV